jgi:hypothetical protein
MDVKLPSWTYDYAWKTKHIDIKVHNIWEKAQFEKVGITYVPTSIQQANFLTKPIVHLHYATNR